MKARTLFWMLAMTAEMLSSCSGVSSVHRHLDGSAGDSSGAGGRSSVGGAGGGTSQGGAGGGGAGGGTNQDGSAGGGGGGGAGGGDEDAAAEPDGPRATDAPVLSDGPLTLIVPAESAELLANPGMGWQTFGRFADSDTSLAGLPSGNAYFSWTWKELEPSDGKVDIDMISQTLANARDAEQNLMIRVMTAGVEENYVPAWLGPAGCKLWTFDDGAGGAKVDAPDLDDPTCFTRFERLMMALGSKFGGEPDLEVDIGGVGLWGRWDFLGTNPVIPLPSPATRKKVLDLHRSAFPRSRYLAPILDVDTLQDATAAGGGWRADCVDDLDYMTNIYKPNIVKTHADNAWQKAPVAWETCDDLAGWISSGLDIHAIFQQTLDLHGSFFNHKSAPIPDEARAEVEFLLSKLGYRLVLRSLSHATSVSAGAMFSVTMKWENTGVAPPYYPFGLSVRLVSQADSTATPVTLTGKTDLRTWLPGTYDITEDLQLPDTLAQGIYTLSVGVTGTPGVPMLRLALQGRDDEGWYPLSALEVK